MINRIRIGSVGILVALLTGGETQGRCPTNGRATLRTMRVAALATSTFNNITCQESRGLARAIASKFRTAFFMLITRMRASQLKIRNSADPRPSRVKRVPPI
jgi:hypothetical protein